MAREAKEDEANGRCFEHVITVALDAEGSGLESTGAVLYVVHGVPRLTRPPFARYWHAWLELELPCGHVEVLDTQFLHERRVMRSTRDTYYAAGRIEPGRCVRYEAKRALTLVGLYRHYGPWHEDEGTADDPVL